MADDRAEGSAADRESAGWFASWCSRALPATLPISYVFELNDRHHGLNVGRDSSFDVTPREAAAIREELGIGSRPIGDGTSFEVAQPAPQSTRDLLLSVIKSGTEIAAGVTLERVACRSSLDASGGPQ